MQVVDCKTVDHAAVTFCFELAIRHLLQLASARHDDLHTSRQDGHDTRLKLWLAQATLHQIQTPVVAPASCPRACPLVCALCRLPGLRASRRLQRLLRGVSSHAVVLHMLVICA